MNFSLYIAKRYLISKSSNNAINIITGIAAVGVVVGAMALFIVLSGFSGLKDFSLQFTDVFDSDLKILPQSGKTIDFSDASEAKLKKIEGIANFSKIIEERVFLQYNGKNEIAYIKGIDENYTRVNDVQNILIYKDWIIPGEQEVIIGAATSIKLSLGVRDYGTPLEIYVPKPGAGQALDPSKAFNREIAIVADVYQINEDLDGKYVFSDLEFARSLLQMDSSHLSSIEIKLKPKGDEAEVREDLLAIFGNDVVVKNRIQQNDALYKMLNTENIAVYLIFTLVLIIALFNVIGSIIMMILDKRRNIKTLYNLGATLKDIRRVFFLQGTLMTTLGGILGILLGVIAVLLQLHFEYVKITATLPYPVRLELINIVIVLATITILGLIASKIASSRVGKKLVS